MLITGGTGSFGNAVLKMFLNTEVKEIRIFSRDELKQDNMRKLYKNSKLKFYIGDVRDINSVYNAMKNVDYVFHAAALKQVPSCEFYPIEAVKTNILGAENVLNASIEMGVKKVIVLSTDKAVYPINAMGISKAMMEKVMIAKARMTGRSETILCGTRYGNVIASRGSVIPLFIEQARNNQPITITDPDMTRFLMSLDEAVKLVLYAYRYGNSGDIFVRKSPAAKIIDLAEAIRQLFNPHIKLKIIGTRHGEKQYETLLTKEEMAKAKETDKYFKISIDDRDLNYEKYFTKGEKSILSQKRDYNSSNTKLLTVIEIKEMLLKIDFIKNKLKRS